MSDSTQDAPSQTDSDGQGGGNQDGGQTSDGGDGGSGQGGDGGSGQDSGSGKGKNALEWAVTLAGAAVVLFVMGFLTYSWITSTDEPADLQVTLEAPRQNGSAVEIPVSVQNDGPRVAEAAVIEVCAGPENCAQITFDYVPFKSKVDGAVGLEAPLAATPTSRVVSFRNP